MVICPVSLAGWLAGCLFVLLYKSLDPVGVGASKEEGEEGERREPL